MGGSSVVKKVRRKLTLDPLETLKTGARIGTGTFGDARKLQKKTAQTQEKPFRKGAASQARDAGNLQAEQIAKQEKTELLRRVESEDEIARRRGAAKGKGAGRRSLIRSSPTGLATTLGG